MRHKDDRIRTRGNMQVRIEKARESEASTLASYLKSMLLYTEKLGWHRASRSPKNWLKTAANIKKAIRSERKHLFLTAKIGNRIVGYSEAIIREFPVVLEPKTCLHISVVYVEEEFRKNGIGERLVKHMIKWGKRFSVKEINLNVHFKNPAAKLYERLGFKTTRLEMTIRVKS
jgi:GNAT superfamily N-acetyltransferase